ncbi:MAG: hypothetical protein Q8O67_11355 [Deltaproteobacteria bacterium]|nr:hypothetical protein [Deltaproteobacteria bacterium]
MGMTTPSVSGASASSFDASVPAWFDEEPASPVGSENRMTKPVVFPALARLLLVADLLACQAGEGTPGVNRCHAFILAPPAGATPLDRRATQDFSLLADLNARFDDKCRFEGEPTDIVCLVGATNAEDCDDLLSEALDISILRERPLDGFCFFACEIE